MQLKSIASTNILDLMHAWEHTPIKDRDAIEGQIIATIDGHVREQMIVAEQHRSSALERRQPSANKF